MKIKTRLILLSLTFAVLLIAMGLLTVETLSLTNKAIKESRDANLMIKDVFELNMVTYQYIMHHEKRMQQQWRLKYRSFGTLLDRMGEEASHAECQPILASIMSDYKALGILFSQLQANFAKRKSLIKENRSNVQINMTFTVEERLMTQTLMRAQKIVSGALEVSDTMDISINGLQQRANLIVLMSIIGFVVLSICISFFTVKSITVPISMLVKGSEIVGAGNLEHRLGTGAKDEIGQLSRAFEQMIANLKETTASRDELEKEVIERKRAEKNIKHLNLVLGAIRDVNQLIVKEKDRLRLIQAACRILFETGAYHGVWIALMDESNNFEAVAEAGLGDEGPELSAMLKNGHVPPCVEKAQNGSEGVVLEIFTHACEECPLADHHAPKRSVLIRLAHEERLFGFLTVSFLAETPPYLEEQSLFCEVAGDIAFALHGIEVEKGRRQAEERQKLAAKVLTLLNHPGEKIDMVREILVLIKESTRLEAVGIRLREGEDYPYYRAEGFPADFVEAERYLCARDQAGEIVRDCTGDPFLECMCGNIICERIDASMPFFTEGGSFWANSTTELLLSTTGEYRQACTRNRCNREDYESVALIPLRSDDQVIGLLQLNDGRKNMFNLEMIKFFEGLGASIGIALERKRMEDALREGEKQFRELAELLPETIFETDLKGNVTFVNRQALDQFGYTRHDFEQGLNGFAMLVAGDRGRAMANIQKALRGENVGLSEYTALKKDGSTFPALLRSAAIVRGGKTIGVRGFIIDITARKRLEAKLVQAQKMEAIGTLAGGIAHDFNNILFPMIGFTEMSMENVPEGGTVHKNMAQVLKAADRARGLVNQILAFSRQTEKERKPIQINPIVKEVVKLLRATLPSTIEIRADIPRDNGIIMADSGEIHQVLMNLGANAYHAMKEKGGILSVALSAVEITADDLVKDLELEPGTYIKIAIGDTGHGMEHKVMERIFDPYFTTKVEGEGTGLGLSVAHGIVKSCHGHISVYSEPGMGTTFNIYLPRIQSYDTVQEIVSTEPLPKGNERILLVDDEEQIVRMLLQMLVRLGYQVTSRVSSVEALETFRAKPEKFDLVITDQTMPDMTGDALAQKLMGIRPGIPIILSTGFSEAVSKERAKALGIRAFVMKPVNIREMAGVIRRVLDQNA